MKNLDVKEIRKKLNYSQIELAKTLGVSTRTIQNWEKGEIIPSTKHEILRNLLNENKNEHNVPKQKQKEVIIPRVELEVIGGTDNSVFGFTEDDIKEYYKVPIFDKLRIDFLISLAGSSMQPRYNSGDVLGCRVIKENSFIEWNKPHVIATKDRGLLFKRIKKGRDENFLLLVSENSEYDPFEIPKDDVIGLAIVVGLISVV